MVKRLAINARNQAKPERLSQHLIPQIEALGLHDVERKLARRHRTIGKDLPAQRYGLPALKQPVQIDIGRDALGIAAGFEDRDGFIDVRQIGAGLRELLLVAHNDFEIWSRLCRSVVSVRISAIPTDLRAGGIRVLWRVRHNAGNCQLAIATRPSCNISQTENPRPLRFR